MNFCLKIKLNCVRKLTLSNNSHLIFNNINTIYVINIMKKYLYLNFLKIYYIFKGRY